MFRPNNPVYLQIWNYFTVKTEQADSKFILSIEPRVHDGIIFIVDEGGIVYVVCLRLVFSTM